MTVGIPPDGEMALAFLKNGKKKKKRSQGYADLKMFGIKLLTEKRK